MPLSGLDPLHFLAIGTISIVILGGIILRSRSPLIKLPYPPGPPEKGLFSGNQDSFPVSQAWLFYVDLAKKYGDILHLRDYHKHYIILNSYEDNVELLDKRSGMYSDRPEIPMLKLMGWDSFASGFLRYGSQWRMHRSLFQKFLKPSASLKHRPIQTTKISHFLYGLLTTPDDFINHYRTLSAAIIMATIYGHNVTPKDDYFVVLAEEAVRRLSEGVLMSTPILRFFPFLQHILAWFPVAAFARFALKAKDLAFKMRDIPISVVQEQMKQGTAPDCIVVDLLRNYRSQEELNAIIDVVGSSFAAGSDTAMTMFPDVQLRAQEEIDSVIGCERLITYDDQSLLPYVKAIHREVMRWRPVLPLSIFRLCSSADVYKGYHIPKGATLISNTWAMAHDERRYLSPETFNPGRFFNADGCLNDDDVGYIFGFGKRMCPGKHMAGATVWLAIATVLQNFNIQKKKMPTGEEIPIGGEYNNGLVIHPLPFECSITPRSFVVQDIILQAVEKSA